MVINVGNTALQSERMNKIHMQKFCVYAKILHTKTKRQRERQNLPICAGVGASPRPYLRRFVQELYCYVF